MTYPIEDLYAGSATAVEGEEACCGAREGEGSTMDGEDDTPDRDDW